MHQRTGIKNRGTTGGGRLLQMLVYTLALVITTGAIGISNTTDTGIDFITITNQACRYVVGVIGLLLFRGLRPAVVIGIHGLPRTNGHIGILDTALITSTFQILVRHKRSIRRCIHVCIELITGSAEVLLLTQQQAKVLLQAAVADIHRQAV